MAILEGFLIGLGTLIFVGPVVFTLLKATMQSGFKAGMGVALGIIVSDIVVVALCALGAIPYFKNTENQFWLGMVGSLILFGLGLKYIIKPGVDLQEKVTLDSAQFTSLFVKGFLVNGVNPFVFLVWIGFIGYGEGKFGADGQLWMFLTAILVGIFTIDTLKVVFAQKLSGWIEQNRLQVIYRVIGLVLIGFGVRMIIAVN